MKKNILVFCGSLRKESVNHAILKHIALHFSDTINVEIYDKTGELPVFNPDLDTENPPPIIQALRTKITEADGVIISTPEYVFSLPGNLKNLLEWNVSTTVFANKPIALIVAAASGQKAFESLSLVMSTITVSPIPDDLKVLFKGIGRKINQEGFIEDEKIKNQIAILLKAFLQKLEE